MPNWASTDMVVYGDMEQLLKFKKLIEDVEALPHSTEPGKIDTHSIWLGKFWKVLGYTDEQMENICCRGYLEQYECVFDCDRPHIYIRYESAWDSCHEIFDDLLAKHFDGLSEVSRVCECGMQVFYHTDESHLFFNDEVEIEASYNGRELYELFENEKVAVESFNKIFKTSFKDLDELEKFADDNDLGDDYIYIHRYECCY